MPELPGWMWAGLILWATAYTAYDSLHTKWHYRNKPEVGCFMNVDKTVALCYSDERSNRVWTVQ